jgi:simple sugar transport system substrate-binding protein
MKRVFWGMMVLLVSLLLAGCGGSSDGEKAEDKFEIVLLVKTEGIAWFDDMKLGVAEFAKDHP